MNGQREQMATQRKHKSTSGGIRLMKQYRAPKPELPWYLAERLSEDLQGCLVGLSLGEAICLLEANLKVLHAQQRASGHTRPATKPAASKRATPKLKKSGK